MLRCALSILLIGILYYSLEYRGHNIVRRSKNWNEGLGKDLRNPRFAQAFLLATIDDCISLQHTLGKVIRAMGVKEFAAKMKTARSEAHNT